MFGGLYFLYIIQSAKLTKILHHSFSLAYVLAWAFFIAVPLLILNQLSGSLSNAPAIAINSLAVIGLWYLVHYQHTIFNLLKKRFKGQNSQYWLFHGVVLLFYMGSFNLLFDPWAVATSIAMLCHAVLLLFLTLSNKYKILLRLSIILYALTAIKVLFHDMNDFSNLHKIIALMGIGSILMLAAYVFQKLRSKNPLAE